MQYCVPNHKTLAAILDKGTGTAHNTLYRRSFEEAELYGHMRK